MIDGDGRMSWRALLAAFLVIGPGLALAQSLPSNRDELAFSYAPLVKRVSPAVVNIYTTTTAKVQRRLPFPFPGMPQAGERVMNSLGSGVLVKSDGLIVSNAHVVKGAEKIRIVLADRREYDARVVMTDERYDLALLRIDVGDEKFPFLEMRDSDSIEVGDVVLAIGNPFGLTQTVTSGIVSAVARSAGGINDSNFFLQTDAAINPGNSGGALVALDGRLIGINTAIFSQSGGGSIGIGFATPSNIVARLIGASDAGGRIVRPWLGVSMQRITSDLAHGLGLARPAGLVVKDVFAGGPGERAGLKRNDVIVALREHPIDDESSLRFRLATIDVDATVPVRILRGGQEFTLQMKLAAPPEDPPRDKSALDGRQPLSGATVVNLSPAVADERGLAEWRPGILVIEVQPGSYAARFIRPGDMVVAINGQDVKNVATLKKRIEAGVSSVTISRDGVPQTIQLR
jgi:Do/DeqQ family serine protease